MNREILDAIEEQTDLRYDSLADAAGWYGTTTAWREDFTANWNSTGPKRAVKRQLNRDKEAEEMAKAKIKIKVSDSGRTTALARDNTPPASTFWLWKGIFCCAP